MHATANEVKTSRFAHLTPKPVSDLLTSLNASYLDSENPVITTVRGVSSTLGRWFAETETAKVTKWFKELDGDFNTEAFLRELREYIVPELVDGYVNCDRQVLKAWCSEAVSTFPISSRAAADMMTDV